MLTPRFVLSALLFVPTALLAADSAVKVKQTQAAYTPASSGPEMFKAYCVSCHGTDAKGHGPAALALKTPPTDLTTLAKDNHSKYPAFRVSAAIRDGNVLSHGSKDMPVWGTVLGSIGDTTKPEVELRITNLTRYIETLQQK